MSQDPLEKAIQQSVNTVSLDKKPRLSPAIADLLNKQIMREMYSCNLYKQLSAWLDDNSWTNGAKLFLKYGNEETTHADKIISYMYDMNNKVDISAIERPVVQAKSIREVLTASLQHEIELTGNWREIAIASMKEGDMTTFGIAQWFISEQIEEEAKFRDFLFKLNLNMPNYELDEEFAED